MTVTSKGYLYGILSAVFYGTIPIFTVPVYHTGLSPEMVLFYRYIISGVMLSAMIGFRRQSFRLTGAQWFASLISGQLMGISSLLLFLAYDRMDSGIAATILFVYPAMVAGLMAILYRERLSVMVLLGMLVAMLGVMMLSVGETGGVVTLEGVLLVLAAAATYAVYFVYLNKSPMRQLTGEQVTFFAILFGTPVFLIYALLSHEGMQLPGAPWVWCSISGLALISTVLSFVLMTRAINMVGPTRTAILGALEPLTALFAGVCFLHETLTLRIVIGAFLILLAVTGVITGPLLQIGRKRTGTHDGVAS